MAKRLVAPNGAQIVGTSEMIASTAHVENLRWENGEVTFDYEGGSDVYWDTSTTQTRDGEILFVDENGDEWSESDLVEAKDEED